MDVQLKPELERFVEAQVRSGRFASAADVVEAGLGLLMQPQLPPAPNPASEAALAAAAAVGADGSIVDDLACLRCRYNLRGLAADGRCPECGLAVRSTLDRDAVLSHSDVRWIWTLRSGALVLAAAIAAWAVPAFLVCHQASDGYMIATIVLNGPRAWPLPLARGVRLDELGAALIVPALAALVLHAVGVWLVAAREPAAADAEDGFTRRRCLMLLAAALPIAAALWWVGRGAFDGGAPRGGAADGLVEWLFRPGAAPYWAGLFATLDLAVHLLLFDHLRRLSTRVLDAALVREARWFATGTTAALGVVAAGCFLMAASEEFVLLLALGTLGLTLCGIGTFILMFAFARAFREAGDAAHAGERTAYAAALAAPA